MEKVIPDNIPFEKTEIFLKLRSIKDADAQVNQLEKTLDITLPSAYRIFLINYQGEAIEDTYFTINQYEEVYCLEGFYGFEGSRLLYQDQITHPQFRKLLEKGYLAIAEDAFGNYILLRIRGEQYGSVYFYWHDHRVRYVYLASNFYEFMMAGHTQMDMFHTSSCVQVMVCQDHPQLAVKNMEEKAYDILLKQETALDKEERLFQLTKKRESYKEGVLNFDTFALKLAVIQQLMYEQECLPLFDVYEVLGEYNADPEDLPDGPIELSFRYFKELDIPLQLADKVTNLILDVDQELYANCLWGSGKDHPLFHIDRISDEELSVFSHLKHVENRGLGSGSFITQLRKAGIHVDDLYDYQDYTTIHLEELLKNWMKVCVYVENEDTCEELFNQLYEHFGGYYRELYHDEIVSWIKENAKRTIQDLGLRDIDRLLQRNNLYLLNYELQSQGNCLLICREVVAFEKALNLLPMLQIGKKNGIWSIRKQMVHPEEQTMRMEEENVTSNTVSHMTPEKELKKEKKKFVICMTLTAIGILVAVILFFFINKILVQKQLTVYEKDLNLDYQIACYGGDAGCILQDTKGNDLIKERFLSIEQTYSSLFSMIKDEENGHHRIYDVKEREYIDGEFLETMVIDLIEGETPLNYKGIIATKDNHTYTLYSEKHKEGITVDKQGKDWVSYGIYDVDKGIEIGGH